MEEPKKKNLFLERLIQEKKDMMIDVSKKGKSKISYINMFKPPLPIQVNQA